MAKSKARAKALFGEWFLADLGDIKVSTERARTEFKGLDELMASIKRNGLLHPLVVSKESEGLKVFYDLIAGERRLMALSLMGWTKIPCTFRENLSSHQKKMAELEENQQRSDLSWQEEISLLAQIDGEYRDALGEAMPGQKDAKGWTYTRTADLLGKSQTAVIKEIKFSKVLDENPDVKERVKEMPLHTAIRVSKQMLEAKRIKRLAEKGKLRLDTSLKLGDCLELIKDIKSESVSLMLTDPPWGIEVLEEERGKSRGAVQSYTTTLEAADNATQEETFRLMESLLPEVARVLVPGGYFFIFWGVVIWSGWLRETLLKSGLSMYPMPIVWDKGRTTSPFRGYEFSPRWEPIFYGFKPPRVRRLLKPCQNILTYPIVSAQEKIHPFEKPIDLLMKLITLSTQQGQLVLDPFAGSGKTLVAAKRSGRRALGFELNEKHFGMAQSALLRG